MGGGGVMQCARRDLLLRSDNDTVDRLSSRYSVVLLVILSIVVASKQYGGVAVTCWCPAQFTTSHREYIQSSCSTAPTFVPFGRIDEIAPQSPETAVYQWVPFILLAQAVLCCLPSAVWYVAYTACGVNVSELLEAASDTSHGDSQTREKSSIAIATKLGQIGAKCSKNLLSVAYMVTKVMYLLAALVQLQLCGMMLGGVSLEGISAVMDDSWVGSAILPRTTLCYVTVRHVARVHNYVLQCAMELNVLSVRLYILLSCWFTLVMIATLTSVVKWLATLYFKGSAQLAPDGVLLLHLVEGEAGAEAVKDIRARLDQTDSNDDSKAIGC